jgi:hypothetical protein
MQTIAAQNEQPWMETFSAVTALYYVLRANPAALRVKQSVYRADEVSAEPLDYVLDVEIKTKRALGEWYYQMFLRAVHDEHTDILPIYMREMLGRLFKEYRLGPDGPYAKLFFDVKNAQVRSFMKEAKSGRNNNNDTESTSAA